MAEHNPLNNMPPQPGNLKQAVSSPNKQPQQQQQIQFNGIHSSHSSRDASPVTRLGHIPSSQLPPGHSAIPPSQLPPSRPSVSLLTQKTAMLRVGNQNTPNMSPKYSTSTPNELVNSSGLISTNSAFSPINPPVLKSENKSSNLQSNQLLLQNIPLNRRAVDNENDKTPLKGDVVVGNQVPKLLFDKDNNHQGLYNNSSNFQMGQKHPQIPQQTTTTSNQFNINQPKPFQQPLSSSSSSNQTILNNSHKINSAQQISKEPINNLMKLTSESQYFSQQNYSYTNQNSGLPLNAQPQQQQQKQQQGILNQIIKPPSFKLNASNNTNLPPQKLPVIATNTSNVPQNNFNLMSQPSTVPTQNHNIKPSYGQNLCQSGGALQPNQTTNYSQPPLPSSSQYKASLHSNRYPTMGNVNNTPQQQLQNYNAMQQPYNSQQLQQNYNTLQQPFSGQQQQLLQQQQGYQQNIQQQVSYNQQNYQPSSVTHNSFSKLWGNENIDLLQNSNILPINKVEAPRIYLGQEILDNANCSSDLFRCTITKIPESNSLLQKARLPLGVLIHPFKDLTNLPVIQCNVIVRCRACRTYINPFVFFVDSKRWKCNLCYRINELPEEFQYDPISKTYGDPSRRPEIKSSTIEYIAPAEYMLRPPQPAIYLFLLDISRFAIESGYLTCVCSVLVEELKNLPGDARTQIGLIAYDSSLHFFSLVEGSSQPHEMTVLDIDDIFLPCPDNLLVNLKDRMDLLIDLLTQLPTKYNNTFDSNSALGAALQAAHKLMGATGGRVTVFQSSLPNIGPGSLIAREDPAQRTSSEVTHLNPANDFYKRLALECSGQQIAVDLFLLNSQYIDIATISGISRFSGGCIYHYPLFKATRTLQSERFERCFRRYLTRKIGFEAVMRIRCTRGLSIHTFHGNFFVRSTDLLSLPNINPDAGFGMQVAIDENLSDVQSICFQAALLYTSSKGERRIRVHTLCLPIVANLQDVINSADQQCIIGLLAKMAVDRSMQSSLSDAREAFINVAIDILSSYKLSLNMGNGVSGLLVPQCLRLLPLYISALLKYLSFRTGTSTRLDDRVKAMIDMKTKPLNQLIQLIYPDLYPVHNLGDQPTILNSEEEPIPLVPHLQLTARCLESNGAFLMDLGEHMILLVCPGVSSIFFNEILGVADYNSISNEMYELPVLNNIHNQRLHQFLDYLNDDKPFVATLQIIRDNSPNRVEFFEKLIEDRVENALSYHEFLQHLKTQVK